MEDLKNLFLNFIEDFDFEWIQYQWIYELCYLSKQLNHILRSLILNEIPNTNHSTTILDKLFIQS